MRLPTILVGSITVSALAELSRIFSTGSPSKFRQSLVRSGAGCLTLAVGGALVCAVLAQPATSFLYGSQVNLPTRGFAYLGVSTALAIVSSWLAVPLMAMRRASTAASVWALGSVLTAGTLTVLPTGRMLTIGLVLPLMFTTMLMIVTGARRFEMWSRAQTDPVCEPPVERSDVNPTP
jgi:O-antigen/teichoic acid export membrane protein